MNRDRSNLLSKTLKLLVCFLILKVTMDVLSNYHDYLPPNFDSAFLRGRASYFSGGYQWAFYSHIAAGPWTLVAGILLISDRIRTGTPRLHRILGRVQVVTVLVFIVPSGIWMAAYAETGMVAGWGFATLALQLFS